ncbi:MAG: hypothetical protein F9K46_15685 [Anaerolineae bacterium]|nr:MAG: hypothetical protein F9K46_15685 [Anaerolineae bacterium]
MTPNLWSQNTPDLFWQCDPNPTAEQWQEAIQKKISLLGLPNPPPDSDTLVEQVLGEGQFGPNRWRLSTPKRIYYEVKPLMPRPVIVALRKLYSRGAEEETPAQWPIEPRYAMFLWEVLNEVQAMTGGILRHRPLWPNGHCYAFVLTHDIETAAGQSYMRTIAEIDESFGFRSSINFIPERYKIDYGLMDELRERGFEIGVHGLKHDGKEFQSKQVFMRRAERINQYLKDFQAVGFRAPLMHREPEWMQVLEIDYDLSFFDTDPYEPMPGGVMTIWPYFVGRFVELPYTLAQDHTLVKVLGEKTPHQWLQKVNFIEQNRGMALVNTHPDYLMDSAVMEVYISFLRHMKARGGFWNALPREVAQWWRRRASAEPLDEFSELTGRAVEVPIISKHQGQFA